MKNRLAPWLLIAPAMALIVFWQGLACWFSLDDFAWLNMSRKVESGASLWSALLTPKAQGTVRVISERLYFLAIHRLFGADALAFRLVAFLTFFAGLALAGWVAARMMKSRTAGVMAAVFWMVSPGLAVPLAWTSAYNQLLCAVCLLAAFALWMKYLETGESRYYWWQWVPFVVGFGVLEVTVVYPALAAGYLMVSGPGSARRARVSAAALFLPSILFAAFHFLAVPKTDKLYQLHFDTAIFGGLYTYIKWALGTSQIVLFHHAPLWAWFGRISTWVLAFALIAYLVHSALRRNWLPLFFAFWFAAALAPFLPLRDHRMDYYLGIPAIGLAMLIAHAVQNARGRWRAVALLLAAVYAGSSLAVTRGTIAWRRDLSEQVRTMVLGAAQAERLHPGRILLLKDVSDDVFYATMLDNAFEYFGAPRVYLAPGEQDRLDLRRELGDVTPYVMAADRARRAVEGYDAIVLSAAGRKLTNVTAEWARREARAGANAAGHFVDAADPMMASMLGPEWYSIDSRARWMPKSATVKMVGPANPGQKLHLHGYAAAAQIAAGPVPVQVAVDGQQVGRAVITTSEEPFDFFFDLPASAVGKDMVVIRVEAGRTFHPPGDPRELGILFGTFAIR